PTLPLKPFDGFTVMVAFPPAPPCTMVRLVGEAERLKSAAGAAAFTVRVSEVVCVKLPEVPLMVSVTVPVVADPLAESESVLLPVAGFGVNIGVTPAGKPAVTEKVTLPPNPFAGLTVMVLLPADPPCVMVMLEGEEEREKSGGGAEPGQAFSKLATLIEPMP